MDAQVPCKSPIRRMSMRKAILVGSLYGEEENTKLIGVYAEDRQQIDNEKEDHRDYRLTRKDGLVEREGMVGNRRGTEGRHRRLGSGEMIRIERASLEEINSDGDRKGNNNMQRWSSMDRGLSKVGSGKLDSWRVKGRQQSSPESRMGGGGIEICQLTSSGPQHATSVPNLAAGGLTRRFTASEYCIKEEPRDEKSFRRRVSSVDETTRYLDLDVGRVSRERDVGGQRLARIHRVCTETPDLLPVFGEIERALSMPAGIDKKSSRLTRKPAASTDDPVEPNTAQTPDISRTAESRGRQKIRSLYTANRDPQINSSQEFNSSGLQRTQLRSSMPTLNRGLGFTLNVPFTATPSAKNDKEELVAKALWDHVTLDSEELTFRAGDVIRVLERTNSTWWFGAAHGRTGWFSSVHVFAIAANPVETFEDCLERLSEAHVPLTKKSLRRFSFIRRAQVREHVVREVIKTEELYGAVLLDLCHGFILEFKKRTNLFSVPAINRIFGNMEDLYELHVKLLKELRRAVLKAESMDDSLIGGCFLRFADDFELYSIYCNNHPGSCSLLAKLAEKPEYPELFEECRVRRGMPELPLGGFLLKPVQRICQYPLQLAELIKYTSPHHQDYEETKLALDAMRTVATNINESKRRLEMIGQLLKWQKTVDQWEGEPITATSSQLIKSGVVYKYVKKSPQERWLYLFDRLLVVCKKDLRGRFVYKERIDMNSCWYKSLPNGRDNHLHVLLRNAFCIYVDNASCDYHVFTSKNAKEAEAWGEAFVEELRVRTSTESPRITADASMNAERLSLTYSASFRGNQSRPVRHSVAGGARKKPLLDRKRQGQESGRTGLKFWQRFGSLNKLSK